MNLARKVFLIAAIYGVLALVPQYFMEQRIGRDFPPPITHPEQFYGFIGVALAWQFLFFVISRDPVRYRPAMVPAILEKLAFGIPCIILYMQKRIAAPVLAVAMIDLLLAALFTISFIRTPR